MATYEFLPDAFDIPIDVLSPLDPTRALSIQLPAPLKTHHPSHIQDLTPHLSTLFSRNLGITNEHLLSAHKASIIFPKPVVRYTLEKQNLLGTHLAILDGVGNEIATWKSPILSLGIGSSKTEIKFPGQSQMLEVKKVIETKENEKLGYNRDHGLHHRHRYAERFVKDGTTYFWEAEPESCHQLALMEVFADNRDGIMKKEVARYAQKSAHEREGLLVLNGTEVDELIVVLTLCALLDGKDSFLN
ncbi:uncharacterized protein LY89DRAFT_743097 [Mollisia scopiformis]|uniref:Uncharacterized protein n=1 Tax=Mollisia scopiformis TaxID=149040 RepID=A0A132B3Y4_MOLSC|nr:uncharacterized protein LY89DRAFT_743097 [Mollisia scopiformis]KUJ07096.1 hypothetical protein LY89DRAFT_743097 [Mollisia scopiformis]